MYALSGQLSTNGMNNPIFDYQSIKPIREYYQNQRNLIPEKAGLYAFWWIGEKRELLKETQRNIVLKGPGEKPVKLRYEDWFPKDAPYPCLYIGKSTNLKKRISQHLLVNDSGRIYPRTHHFEKVKPKTTSCQLRTGMEHIFPNDKNPISKIMEHVGLSLRISTEEAAVVERFYLEDYSIGYYRPWFNLDSER